MFQPLDFPIVEMYTDGVDVPLHPVLTSILHSLPKCSQWHCVEADGHDIDFVPPECPRQIFYWCNGGEWHTIHTDGKGTYCITLMSCSFTNGVPVYIKE